MCWRKFENNSYFYSILLKLNRALKKGSEYLLFQPRLIYFLIIILNVIIKVDF